MASTIVQVFLKQVLESYFNSQTQVRIAAVSVLHLILKQGLVHPVQVCFTINYFAICDMEKVILSQTLVLYLFAHVISLYKSLNAYLVSNDGE